MQGRRRRGIHSDIGLDAEYIEQQRSRQAWAATKVHASRWMFIEPANASGKPIDPGAGEVVPGAAGDAERIVDCAVVMR